MPSFISSSLNVSENKPELIRGLCQQPPKRLIRQFPDFLIMSDSMRLTEGGGGELVIR